VIAASPSFVVIGVYELLVFRAGQAALAQPSGQCFPAPGAEHGRVGVAEARSGRCAVRGYPARV